MQDPMASWFGWLFITLAVLFILCGLTFSGLLAWAGRSLDTRRHYTFCMVMAALACAFFPVGTVLGVFTLIVLSKPSVRELFRPGPAGTRAERGHA